MPRLNIIQPLLILILTIHLILASASPQISIRNAKLSLASADGSDSRSFDLSPPTPIPSISFQRDSILKLTFESINPSSNDIVKPTQAHLRFNDLNTGDGWSFGIGMKGRGKGRFDLKASTLPTQLTHSTGSLSLTLLLSTPSLSPLQYEITNLTLPTSLLQPSSPYQINRHALPPQQGMPTFTIQDEIVHTFREEEKIVGGAKSLIGTILVWGLPWFVLVGLVPKTLKNIPKSSSSSSLSYLFLFSLMVLEGLILKYWINWTLGPFIPSFTIASLFSAYIGKLTLGSIQSSRLLRSGSTTSSTPIALTSDVNSAASSSTGGKDLALALEKEEEGKSVGKVGIEVVPAGAGAGTGTGGGMKNRKSGKK